MARLVDPEGAGKARYLIVGGRTRGVVCSASYEARQMGVRSAMPISRARRLCPQAMCVPVPHRECGVRSREIRAVLEKFAPVVQAASIDEWYLDLSGTEALYQHASLATVAHQIRTAILETTGLPVSFGGGTNRLIAKLAVERAKPKPGTTATGVHVVEPGHEPDFMSTVTLAEIPMIGPRFREQLERLGMRVVPDVLQHSAADLTRMLGARAGDWLARRARGLDDAAVHEREHARSLSHEETFARDLVSDVDLETELVRLVTRVASDLRARGLAARTVSLKLRDSDFKTRGASRTLPTAVVSDRPLLATAHELLRKLRKARRAPARLLGVALTGLDEPDVETQLSLFGNDGDAGDETPRDRALATAVDRVRRRFGDDSLTPARLTEVATPSERANRSGPRGRKSP